MTDHKFDNFSQYFHNWQKNLINFALKRNLTENELENYIRSFRNIDSEIYKSLFAAKEFYDRKRRYYKRKMEKLKQQEFDFKRILEYAYNERKKVTEPKKKDELLTSITHIKNAVEELEYKLYNLNKKIEEQTLDLDEESNIIEEIQTLDKDRQINLRHLKKLEGDLSVEIQSNMYFKTERTIEILEVNLKGIQRKLNKWSKRKVKTHKEILDLYRKAKKFGMIKIQIEQELLGAKQTTDKNLQLFYELKKQSEKKAFKEQFKIIKDKAKAKEIHKSKTKYIIRKKRSQKSYTKAKLATALQKQKSGKKLDFYEFKLIMEHSHKKK